MAQGGIRKNTLPDITGGIYVVSHSTLQPTCTQRRKGRCRNVFNRCITQAHKVTENTKMLELAATLDYILSIKEFAMRNRNHSDKNTGVGSTYVFINSSRIY